MHMPDVMNCTEAPHHFTADPVMAVQGGEFELSSSDLPFEG